MFDPGMMNQVMGNSQMMQMMQMMQGAGFGGMPFGMGFFWDAVFTITWGTVSIGRNWYGNDGSAPFMARVMVVWAAAKKERLNSKTGLLRGFPHSTFQGGRNYYFLFVMVFKVGRSNPFPFGEG